MISDRSLAAVFVLLFGEACTPDNIQHDTDDTGSGGAQSTTGEDPSSTQTDGSPTTGTPGPTSDGGTTTGADSIGESTSEASGDSSGTNATDTVAVFDLDDWTKRRPIYIDNSNEEPLDDHEVLFLLDWDNDMNADLSDLRFTDEAGTALLPHWIEKSLAPVSMSVWVRVPHVDAMDVGTIYLWYGNPDADGVSDPAATFHVWDGFDGNALDPMWTSDGEYLVAAGALSVTTGAVYSVAPLIDGAGWVAEARTRWPNADGGDAASGLAIADAQGLTPDVSALRLYYDAVTFTVDAILGDGSFVWGQNLVGSINHPISGFEWIRIATGSDTLRAGSQHVLNDTSNVDHAGTLDEQFYVWLGNIGGTGIGAPNPLIDIDIDALLVRRFELSIPETFAGAEENV